MKNNIKKTYSGWESYVATIVIARRGLSKKEKENLIDELISLIKKEKEEEYQNGRKKGMKEVLYNLADSI